MWVGMRLLWIVGWRCEGKGNGETLKHVFDVACGPCVVYVHYFKDIRQGACASTVSNPIIRELSLVSCRVFIDF